MTFPRVFPVDDPTLHDQRELSEVTDQEFHDAWYPPTITFCQRIGQFFLFLLSLGFLRLGLMIAFFLVYAILIMPIVIFAHYPNVIKVIKPVEMRITQLFIRLLMYCCGIIWVKKDGHFNENARNYIYNHTSLFDGLIVYCYHPFSVVCHAGLRKIPIFGPILVAAEAVFIDRSQQSGNSQLIKQRIEDHSKQPCATAPEGKISNGTVLFKFRTGGFLGNAPIQPVTIRYHQIWTWCGCSLNWLCDGFFDWIFGVLCIPFSYVTITYLDTIYPSDEVTPQERAIQCQLAMANQLGIKAINRTSREIFVNESNQQEAATPQTHLLSDQLVPDELYTGSTNPA